MTCKKQTAKKYLSRSSPPYSAMDCKGKTMKGKDGTYISKADKNNIYKWVKIGTGKKTRKNMNLGEPKNIYTVIDNGAQPYLVYDYGNKVVVYGNKYDMETKKFSNTGKLLEIKYKKLFVGYDEDNNRPNKSKNSYGIGNTILLQTGAKKYTLIGDGIRSFTLTNGDRIIEYRSPIGNSDVPYQYAIGDKYVYFLLADDMCYAVKENVDLEDDVYSQFYKINGFEDKDLGKIEKVKTKNILTRFAHLKA
jgi:hypothetical protein